jgi:hypothetical protein
MEMSLGGLCVSGVKIKNGDYEEGLPAFIIPMGQTGTVSTADLFRYLKTLPTKLPSRPWVMLPVPEKAARDSLSF